MNSSAPSPSRSANHTVGWVSSPDERGTIDILWSSCVIIILCVWVSTYPNAPAPTDRFRHRLIDKINLALIGLLGPDLLLGIAIGQCNSARRSVKKFFHLSGGAWTLTHGFFAGMGGFHLQTSDFPDGFPLDAEQLYYLVQHEFVDMPTISKTEISDIDKSDLLSKLIALWQMFWFCFTVGVRVHRGYSITTLELTVVTFAVMMLATSIVWFCKPQINVVTKLCTRNMCSMESIRAYARSHTHPRLPQKWYRTPMDFASPRDFVIDKHWAYYVNLSICVHLPLFHRADRIQWDRIPSDIWQTADEWIIALGLLVQIPFCVAFLAAWNFYFASQAERNLWRAASVYHASFSLFGTFYVIYRSMITQRKRDDRQEAARQEAQEEQGQEQEEPEEQNEYGHDERVPFTVETEAVAGSGALSLKSRLRTWAAKMRNLSPDKDPNMAMPLRWTVAFFFLTVVYMFCRLYFYVEDLASLRSQPADVYESLNLFHSSF